MKISYTVTIGPEQVALITPENLLAYALRTGWTATYRSKYSTVVARPFRDGARPVRIPTTLETEDWSERVSDALQTFCKSEQRDPRDIVRDIVGRVPAENLLFECDGDPEYGECYRNKKTGTEYLVQEISLDSSNPTRRLITYLDVETSSETWTRELGEFREKFERVQ